MRLLENRDPEGSGCVAKKRNAMNIFHALILISIILFSALPASAASSGGQGTVRSWILLPDTSLKASLEAWAETAGWELVWEEASDYLVSGSIAYQGTFDEALSGVLGLLDRSGFELGVSHNRQTRRLRVYPLAHR